jgi:uncharacterized protein (DUF1330 family)
LIVIEMSLAILEGKAPPMDVLTAIAVHYILDEEPELVGRVADEAYAIWRHAGKYVRAQRAHLVRGRRYSTVLIAGKVRGWYGSKEARMGTRWKISLAMLSCTAVGALANEAVHAQARPQAYLIGQIDGSDANGYADEYLPRARQIIKAHGGRLIAAAGAAATGSRMVPIDGEAPERVVIYVYPSMEALQAWRNDPEYVQVRRVGEKYAKYHTFAVEGAVGSSP